MLSKLDPQKFANSISEKSVKLEKALTKKSIQALNKLQKEEDKLRKILFAKDSLAANNLFNQSKGKYEELKQGLLLEKVVGREPGMSNYLPFLDTLKTSLGFLEKSMQNSSLKNLLPGDQLKEAIGQVDLLKGKFNQAADIQQFLRERKQYLKEQFEKVGLGKHLKKLNKKAFYYSQLVKDYKEIFSDPKKIEKQAIAILNKIPAFQNFIKKNSLFASLFGAPVDDLNNISLAGLQTRAVVQQAVSLSAISSGPNPSQYIGQQLQSANNQLNAFKNKIAFIDLSGLNEPLPDFKVNEQKTKPFLKRLEIGTNIQFSKPNNFLPTSSDLAFSIGYKLNDNGVVGVGSSYKLGLGTIRKIQISNQGFGLRSFIDWKIKGNFYVSGGYEKNYLPQIQDINTTQPLNSWQESGLLGISKKYTISKKRKLSIQVYFDLLSYKNIPRSQPLLFRTGWIF